MSETKVLHEFTDERDKFRIVEGPTLECFFLDLGESNSGWAELDEGPQEIVDTMSAEILRLAAALAEAEEIETDFIAGEHVPRPDIDTVRRWIGTAKEEGYLQGVREAEEKTVKIWRAKLAAAEDRARREWLDGMREVLAACEEVAGGEWRELMGANLSGRPDVWCCAKIERLIAAAEREPEEGGNDA